MNNALLLLQGMVSALPAFVRSRSSNSTSKAASAALDAVLEALADDEVGWKHAGWKALHVQLIGGGPVNLQVMEWCTHISQT